MFDTTKVRQDYTVNAGEMKISQSHIFVREKIYFDIINFRILCVCLRKFRVNRSGSFCFIVLQNQSPRFLLTISGRRKFSKRRIFSNHLQILVEYTLEYCASVCENFVKIGPVVFVLLHQESNYMYSVIY